ncbi:glycosyltransferase [Chamaesiphon sp. OTE_75_metabat_556]|uniref:glycosyltransferase family 4 protein n=1 Tax=Chamaesiphon sp. OTE_75_metabat_556 TaxID=2964692 RepID=UPI00286C46FA|nr:glycosyltransferase [Chamaesiphon sp. OTE_75_metabat_556]
MKRLKVLISAYACRPGEGSEPGVGWNVVRELSEYHDIWVLTRSDNRMSIESELTRHPIPGLNFIYCEPPTPIQKLNSNQKLVHLHYYSWQIAAYLVARNLHREVNFNIVHHVTYVRYSSPSFLSLLPVPFIWGTVGGGESAPRAFWADFSWRAKMYESIRSLAHRIGELDPFTRLTAQRSVLVRATTAETADRLRQMGAREIEIFPESGLSAAEIEHLAQFPLHDRPNIRFISMARLLHWKGLHLGIRAFARANIPSSEYWILGDGIEKQRLQDLAARLGISDRVKFWGRLPRQDTLEQLAESDVLVHPSLHDSGGWVCLEAMAAGRPPICLDLGGPAIQVTEATGLKIYATTPNEAIAGLAAAMTQLAQNRELLASMSQSGRKRVKEMYSWQIKGQLLAQLYTKLDRSGQIENSTQNLI